MNHQTEYQYWKNHQDIDQKIKNELEEMKEADIEEAFSSPLQFGTAGIRGVMGAGTARMNIYTLRKAVKAFILYLKKYYSDKELLRGVVIAHDNRYLSTEFSQDVAEMFTSENIVAYLYENNDLRPTPVLSYTVRKIKAIAGAVITASHNPPEYNGFKIYDENGCQFLPVVTDEIGYNMTQIQTADVVKTPMIKKELLKTVPLEIEEDYRDEVLKLQFYPEQKRNLKIIFSNQHGTSRDWVVPILRASNYEVIPVKEQWDFDPDFKNTPSPNPENASAFDLAIKYAKEEGADLIIVNDPDSDRIGIGVKHNKEYVLLNGNETAPILLEYLLSHYQTRQTMPANPVMYNTFVTGHLSDLVAQSYGCQVIKTLTGFKWIGHEMTQEKARGINFVFGFEEAYGYVVKDITRDKDGIAAAMVLAEAVWYYKNQNQSLVDVLEQLYQKHGYFYFNTVNVVLKGISGSEQIKGILQKLRHEKITELASNKLVKKEDYLEGLYNMPPQDLLKFYFEDTSWFAVRASGTEPKIKFYFVCVDRNSVQNAANKMATMFHDLEMKYLKLEKTLKEGKND